MISIREGHKRAESGTLVHRKGRCEILKKSAFFAPDFPFNIQHYIHKDSRVLHRHQFIELVYVWEGGAVHCVNGKRSRLHKGDVFILSRKMKHRFIITPPEFLEIINCLFLPSLIDPHLSSLKDMKGFIDFSYIQPFIYPYKHRLRLSGMEDVRVRNLLQDMLTEFSSRQEGWQAVIKAKLVELLVTLSRNYKKLTAEDNHLNQTMGRHREGMLRAINYLEKHYAERIKLEQVAELAYLSKSPFSELFKSLTGKTFIEYLLDIRLNKAVDLLKDTDLSITEVCYEVGFRDLSYFERTFKKFFDISPGRYRKREKKQK